MGRKQASIHGTAWHGRAADTNRFASSSSSSSSKRSCDFLGVGGCSTSRSSSSSNHRGNSKFTYIVRFFWWGGRRVFQFQFQTWWRFFLGWGGVPDPVPVGNTMVSQRMLITAEQVRKSDNPVASIQVPVITRQFKVHHVSHIPCGKVIFIASVNKFAWHLPEVQTSHSSILKIGITNSLSLNIRCRKY